MSPDIGYFINRGLDTKKPMEALLTREGADALNQRIHRESYYWTDLVKIKYDPQSCYFLVTKLGTSTTHITKDENYFVLVYNSSANKTV